MANGPIGGFMPTPPSPGQPPQVSLDTNAESRSKFNSFLGTLPKNGAVAPIQTGLMQSSTAPVSPMMDNVNIFQPQMAPMMQQPMQQPMQPPMMGGIMGKPVQNFYDGGYADSDFGGFSDYSSVDSPSDYSDFSGDNTFSDNNDNNDDDDGFSFDDDDANYQTDDRGIFTGGDDNNQDVPISVIDTRPRTNVRNVGARSNLRYDPQFAANIAQSRGIDPSVSLRPADFAQTTQGGATAPTLSSGLGLPSFRTGTGSLAKDQLDILRPSSGINPIAQTSRVSPTRLDFGLGLDLDDPLGLGRTTSGVIEGARDVQRMRGPENFQEIASLNRVVPGAGGTLPDADPLSTDVLGAIRSGAAGLPFTNNPGALKQGQEDLTTEVIKGLPDQALKPGQNLSQDFLAPAIFNSLDAGIQGIDRQLGLYAGRPSVNITNPVALANTYLGSTNATKENSKENQEAYANAIRSAAGNEFNLNDASTRANISKAIANQEFGQAGRDIMAEMRRGTDASVLDGLNLNQLALNQPLTSNVSQLGSLDPIQPTQSGVPIGEQLAGSRGDIVTPDAPFGAAPTTPGRLQAEFGSTLGAGILTPEEVGRATRRGQRETEDFLSAMRMPGLAAPLSQFTDIAPPSVPVVPQDMQDIITQDENLTRIERAQQAIQDARNTGRPQFNLGPGQRGVDLQQSSPAFARGMANIASVTPEFDLETLRGVREQTPTVDTVFDIDTTFDPITLDDRLTTVSPERLASIQQGQNIDIEDDQQTFRSNVPDEAKIFGGRQIQTTPIDFASVVGDDPVADLNIADIVGNVNQERVSDILNRPEAFKSTFKIGDVEFPNLLATLANKAGTFFDRRLFDAIVSKGLDAVVDPDTGRIIGAKNEIGQLIEGRDLEQFQSDDGESDPVARFLKTASVPDEDDMTKKPPNVIGGTEPPPADPDGKPPTVVESKFPASTASFTPVDFDAGNLNDLIERITGVSAPRKLQDGGVISSVDNFLTKVA